MTGKAHGLCSPRDLAVSISCPPRDLLVPHTYVTEGRDGRGAGPLPGAPAIDSDEAVIVALRLPGAPAGDAKRAGALVGWLGLRP